MEGRYLVIVDNVEKDHDLIIVHTLGGEIEGVQYRVLSISKYQRWIGNSNVTKGKFLYIRSLSNHN